MTGVRDGGGQPQRRKQHGAVGDQRAADVATKAGRPPRRHVPHEAQRSEQHQEVQAVPFARRRQAQAASRGDPPPPDAQSWPGPLGGQPGRARGEPLPGLVAVDDQAAEPGEYPEHHEDVQHRGPAHHELKAVKGQQQARDAAEQIRAGDPPGDARQQQDGRRPGDRGGEPPAEGVEAEQPLPEGDLDFSERRVRGENAAINENARRVPAGNLVVGEDADRVFGAVVQDPERLRRVETLVEDDSQRRGQRAEPQPRAKGGHEQRPRPSPHRGVAGPGQERREQLVPCTMNLAGGR
jgi:hypothetical protein